jgi:type II secretory pathway predicted ATPase ExeA
MSAENIHKTQHLLLLKQKACLKKKPVIFTALVVIGSAKERGLQNPRLLGEVSAALTAAWQSDETIISPSINLIWIRKQD